MPTSNPIIFALANPDPEINYEDAMDSRADILMGESFPGANKG